MSNYEWEKGTVVLPPKDARRIRAALNEESDKRRAAITQEVGRFLEAKGSGGRTRESFKSALEQWREGRWEQLGRPSRYEEGRQAAQRAATEDAIQQAYWFLDSRCRQGKLGKPTASEVKGIVPAAPKTGMATYDVVYGSVSLDGNRLGWDVEGNHGVESAREKPLAQRLFRELDTVEWTKGTGGEFRGNNEYNEASGEDYTGSGGSYQTAAYGPLGDPHFTTKAQAAALVESAAQWRRKSPANAGKCGMRTMLNGKRHGPPCRNAAYGCPVHNPRRASRW